MPGYHAPLPRFDLDLRAFCSFSHVEIMGRTVTVSRRAIGWHFRELVQLPVAGRRGRGARAGAVPRVRMGSFCQVLAEIGRAASGIGGGRGGAPAVLSADQA
jgi:hypothetical protein